MIERIAGVPEFLSVSGLRHESTVHEIVSRRRLDTRQVVPYFEHEGELHVGVLERTRATRMAGDRRGLEPIGFDFSGVDETADIRDYGRAIFSARAGVEIDGDKLAIPLPSMARSIGWNTELALPLLLPIRPPPSRAIEVSWDGGHHRILFRRANEPLDGRFDEQLGIAIAALSPRHPRSFRGDDRGFLERVAGLCRDHEWLARAVRAPSDLPFERREDLRGEDLRFLRLERVRVDEQWWEIVTPRDGISVALLPYVVAEGEPHFLLWAETRMAALERRARQPIYDLPVHPRHINATARYVARDVRATNDPRALAEAILRDTMAAPIRVVSAEILGTAEPAPSFGAELRTRVACRLDPTSIEALPEEVAIVSAGELVRAVNEGVVRDPVLVAGLLDLGFDVFDAVRHGDPAKRRAFLDRMTEGSVVQRRLRSYSSIEQEQLEAPTYARVMLLLQHEYGVRIAYPESENDRSFFKAAFRVFMAAPRGDEDRAMQGLHWSHDAFHFALGNFTLPMTSLFEDWYLSDEGLRPPLPPEGPLFDAYARALKSAEDEATFFSFWQLYEEKPSLARHVGKLTFFEALRDLDVRTRRDARKIFDDVTARALIPERVRAHPAYAREDLRSLFEYMRGFRDYHLGDIRAAWAHASRDMYRGFFLRFGIYESDADRYVANVHSFMDRLAREPPGLDPLRAAGADVRVAIALRVFDLTKSLRLQRKFLTPGERRLSLDLAHVHLEAIEHANDRLGDLRAKVHDAEISRRNEECFAAIRALADEVESIRAHIWDDAATVLPADVVASERTRELPR